MSWTSASRVSCWKSYDAEGYNSLIFRICVRSIASELADLLTQLPIMETNDSPNFESSLAELQQIVAQLEGGTLGLDESLAEFERGVKLLRTCYQMLETAEQKIELLVGFNEKGEP